MGKLTSKQKKIIQDWVKKNGNILPNASYGSLIPAEVFERLKRINNYETLWQDAVRYAMDTAMKARYS